MEQFYNKHYIRLNANNHIIKGFSDAFETPLETDICINEQGSRHFELNGEVNPSLINQLGQPLYSYIEEEVIELTEEERNTLYPIPEPEPSKVDVLESELIVLQSENTALKMSRTESEAEIDFRLSMIELGFI